MSDYRPPDAATIIEWIVRAVQRKHAELNVDEIDFDTPFAELGLDSVELADVAGELEERLGFDLPETVLFETPTIRLLAAHLSGVPTSPTYEARYDRTDTRDDAARTIAIVGMSCRFPGANDIYEFWRLIEEGRDALVLEPAERAALRYEQVGRRHWGGFLADIDAFAAEFFNITPKEAALIDPQQRLFLEVAWHALEDAGWPAEAFRGHDVGVFVGVSGQDYATLVSGLPELADIHAATGSSHSVVANRVSYLLDLRGPSIAVDTACSSSLVAIHLACQSLLSGDADAAIAGGVNVVLSPLIQEAFTKAGVMAPDGRCKAFRADADGYVRGEGCGVVVLKRLNDAIAAGDRIHAVVRGSAINQDGFTNGLTAPNGAAQRNVIQRALRRAEARPSDVGYVEAHGTGTVLGDPIEVRALAAELGAGRSESSPCSVGSVKANIGHLEAAAGVAGLIKTVLAIRAARIPAQPEPGLLNDRLDLADGRLRIAFEPVPWPDTAPLAGVSSFGFGGTNAHIVVGPAPPVADRRPIGPERTTHLLTLSARTADSLRAQAALVATARASLADLCFTVNTGRTAFEHRATIMADDISTLRRHLRAFAGGAETDAVRTGADGRRTPRPVFVFAGQGSQHAGMARELFEQSPVFRSAIDRCDEVVAAATGRRLIDVILAEESTSLAGELRCRSELAQPVLVAVECALAELWQSWGITPVAVLGHSLGEYSASVVAGVHDLFDVLRLVATRGRLLDDLDIDGGLLSVFEAPDIVAELVSKWPEVVVAGRNSRHQTLLAGPTGPLAAAASAIDSTGRTCRRIDNPPSHSAMMEPIRGALSSAAETVPSRPANLPLVTSVDPRRVEVGETLASDHWTRHLCQPLDFPAALALIESSDATAFIELGPSAHMTGLVRDSVADRPLLLPSLRTDGSDWQTILGSLACLWIAGGTVDWAGFDGPYNRHRVDISGYPFERTRHWIDVRPIVDRSQSTGGAVSPAQIVPSERHQAPDASPVSIADELLLLIAEVTGLAPAQVHPTSSLYDLGMDSVLVVELRNRLEERTTIELPPLSAFVEAPSIGDLSRLLLTAPAHPVVNTSNFDDLLRLVESADDEEIARLLSEDPEVVDGINPG